MSTHTRSTGLRRSARLFADFLHEQDDPARFYTALAEDSVAMVSAYAPLPGSTILDVGAGPLFFARAFERAGATYIGCDVDAGDFTEHTAHSLAVACVGEQLPFRTDSLDITFTSNVLEHVPDPRVFCEEMLRVTRPGGVAIASFTNWLSPWGGHETSPWHWFGGEYAARRYQRKTGHPPKNLIDESLFRLSIKQMMALAPTIAGGEVLDMRPRYWPGWSRGLLKVPGLREVATWNLWIAWRKRG